MRCVVCGGECTTDINGKIIPVNRPQVEDDEFDCISECYSTELEEKKEERVDLETPKSPKIKRKVVDSKMADIIRLKYAK